MLGSNN